MTIVVDGAGPEPVEQLSGGVAHGERRLLPGRSRVSDRAPTAILIGCVSRKRSQACAARELYVSPLFRGRQRYAEASGRPWLILSALHGLVEPSDVLEPYDLPLASLPIGERRAWGARVADQLAAVLGDLREATFEVHAGDHYARALEPELARRGASITRPLAGLTLGRQLQWYAREASRR
jgi:hypothetical protein